MKTNEPINGFSLFRYAKKCHLRRGEKRYVIVKKVDCKGYGLNRKRSALSSTVMERCIYDRLTRHCGTRSSYSNYGFEKTIENVYRIFDLRTKVAK